MRDSSPTAPCVGSTRSPIAAIPPITSTMCASRRHSNATSNSLRVSMCITPSIAT